MQTKEKCLFPLDYLRKNQEIYWQLLHQPVLEMEQCRVICTDIPSPWLNGVIETNLRGQEVPRLAKTFSEYFQQRNLPFCWWMEESDEPSHFAEELSPYDINYHEKLEGMVLNLEELREIPRTDQLKIQVVSNRDDFHSFLDVLLVAYEAKEEAKAPVAELFLRGGLKFPIFHFLGKEKGKPVTAGSLFIYENMAGIYHVATVPEARKKGYASQLMYAILKHAQYHRCLYSFLTSTPMANNLYKQLGYKTVTHFHFYIGNLKAC